MYDSGMQLKFSVFSLFILVSGQNYFQEMLHVCLIVCISRVTMETGSCYGSGVGSDMRIRTESLLNCLQLALSLLFSLLLLGVFINPA